MLYDFFNNEESINENFGYTRLNKPYSTCKKCRNRYSKKQSEYYNENKDSVNGKVECKLCGSIVSRHGISRHRRTNKCSNNNSSDTSPISEPKEKPITPSIKCEVCNKFVKNMDKHKKGNRCLKLDNLSEECISNNVKTCEICGINVFKSRMDDHKLTVGCLTKYISGITERPFNRYNQWRYDYLMKKRKEKINCITA
jgi:hypothetical protein